MDEQAKTDRETGEAPNVATSEFTDPPPLKRSLLELVAAEFERDRSHRIEYRSAHG